MKRQTSTVLTAPAGTGKSYMVVADIVDQILPLSDLRIWTNLFFGVVPESHSVPPAFTGETFLDRMQSYVDAKYPAAKISVSDRVLAIDRVLLDRSKLDEDHAWLKDWDVGNSVIILDEAHNFAGAKHSKNSKRQWQEFVGELRHRGASIIFVTQHPGKLAAEIIAEAGLRQALVDAEEERDPFFGIKLYYWYELRAKITGVYDSCFVRIDLRDIDGRKSIRSNVERVKRRQEIFALYDSASAPEAGGVANASQTVREFQRRSFLGLLLWFVGVNWSRFIKPCAFALFMASLIFYGEDIFAGVVSLLGAPGKANKVEREKQEKVVKVAASASAEVGAELDIVRAELQAVRGRLAELEAVPVVVQLVAFDWCVVGGVVYKVGDVVDGGVYKGKAIEAIDFRKRAVRVDGKWLYCKAENAQPIDTAPRVGRTSSGGGRAENRRAENNVVGQ